MAVDQDDGSRNQIRILLVDDDSSFADLTADFLARENDQFVIETANSATEVVEENSEFGMDCIVSDYDMPDLDGIEFLQLVREDYPDLPFILFTGKGSEEVASEAITKGVTDYLQKRSGSGQYKVLANRIQNAVDRHRAELAVEFERNRRSPLFEHSPDPIVEVEYVDSDAQVTAINRAFKRTFDVDEEEVLGEAIVDIEARVATDQDRSYLETIQEQVRHGQSVSREVVRTVDGSNQEFLLRIFPFEIGHNTRRAYGWYIDLSERKAAERRFREIFERSNEAMLVVDPHREKIAAANPAAADLLGYDRSELLELAPRALHPHDIDRFRTFIASVDRDGSGWTDELSCYTKRGDTIAVEISASMLDPGTTREMLAIIRESNARTASGG